MDPFFDHPCMASEPMGPAAQGIVALNLLCAALSHNQAGT